MSSQPSSNEKAGSRSSEPKEVTTKAVETRIVAIIQARMSSSRLPGKVLLDLGGRPMLTWVVERTRQASMVDEVVVATTTDPSDDPIEAYCLAHGYPFYRGSLYDVLDRYYQAARLHRADVIVRITADCPLIDPGLVDRTISAFLDKPGGCDFAANRLPPPWGRTYPIGLDTEVCSFAGLETAWQEAIEPHQREHVMPFFYENPQHGGKDHRFKIVHVNHPIDYGTLRWTVDTPEDLEVVRQLVARLSRKDKSRTDRSGTDTFTWLDVLEIHLQEPELGAGNAHIQPKDFRQFDHRQKEVEK